MGLIIMVNKNYKVLLSILLMSSWLSGATLSGLTPDPAIDTEFVIIVPSYNNEKFYKKNLDSIVNQISSRPYEIIYINDCSTDNTGSLVDAYVREHHLEDRMTVIHNQKNQGALANFYNTIHTLIPDHKVVITVDGDDSLISNHVLLRLEQEYKDPDVWMTFGSYKTTQGKKGMAKWVPREIFEERSMRSKKGLAFHHLRTFKAGLFKKIKRNDLLYKGKFFPMAWDMAMMFPMAEMCSPKDKGGIIHARYIPERLYLYNMDNPISDKKKNKHQQFFLALKVVKRMKPYEPIHHL